MLRDLGGVHLWIILLIIVLLFGASRLPAVSKGIAQSVKIFRKEVSNKGDDDDSKVAASEVKTPSDEKK
jgi:sec-independent protein translocase protein TatA